MFEYIFGIDKGDYYKVVFLGEFLNQMHAWFLRIAFVRMSVCVCVSTPRAIKNHSREINPEKPIKQVLLLFGFFVRHLLSILLMGRALVMKCIMSYCQRRAR